MSQPIRSIILALGLVAGSATAAGLCPDEPDYWLPWPDPGGGRIDIDAAQIDLGEPGVAVLRGGVVIRDARQELTAGEVRYYRDDDRALAEGPVGFRTGDIYLQADYAELELDADRGRLDEVRYRLREGGGRGEADVVTLLDPDHSSMETVTYTTCPLGDPSWLLRARRIALDYEAGTGAARSLTLRFKDVPILYLPYASFPIDDRRKSGFLYPSLATSGDNGIDLKVPYYWNIAPNQDATLSPRLISDRGVMLGAEYRYLWPGHAGQLHAEYLPDDDDANAHRAYASYQHRGRLSDRLRLDVDLNHVSDAAYFEDFGDSLTAASRSYLRSVAALSARGDWWRATLMADAYETVDVTIRESQEPYDRLPRAVFSGHRPLADWLELDIDAEAVTFDRDSGVEGTRVDLYPRLSSRIYRPAWYLNPSVGVRHTAYRLDRAGDDTPQRTTPIASVEGGLFFERRSAAGWLQTLEPRFHYLYVPFEPQSDLPEFDTREITFGFGQLFRSNRFTGADRQADANQLSLALTTRLHDQQRGRQVLEASVGTIAYFRDQKVQLSSRPASDRDTSPLIGEVHYRPSDFWRASLGIQYDPEHDEFDQTVVSVQHRLPGGRIFNAAYRRRNDLVRQLDVSGLYPINPQWSVIGRLNYSLLDHTDLETLLGFEYKGCCWALRAFARRYIRNQEGDKRNGIYLELELIGLGSIGRTTGGLLERAILGYRSQDYR